MTVISVHSPKGGSGTTLIAARLAMSFAGRGRPVTLIDYTRQDTLKLHFGMVPSQTIQPWQGAEADAPVIGGVRLVKGYGSRMAAEQLVQDFSGGDTSQLFIFDISSSNLELRHEISRFADFNLCVLEPSPADLTSLTLLDEGQSIRELQNFGVVLNRVDEQYKLSRHCRRFLAELLGEQYFGIVRRDEAVNEALAQFEVLEKFAPQSVVLRDVTALTNMIEAHLKGEPGVSTEGADTATRRAV
ncbi:cellulose synthase operon protein YhjQ/BcsQ [Hyphomonas pacifica]|uniref:CobQ/CobB/MinD/ParA nucleotide binding domain-containing protein n=1 Tax=Hyphomonas pacifica TaxID=1280941 RepID=A0A062TVS5_9PROT|nr:cellulose synthase operon protein YhjQ/BcsQ [Hyphomonas pacifica]KCZ47444.1 hypothetical protein HY2_04830 [Hyphomonas pacifica]RAN31361.1 hypothetical protein HY3_04530 [Hyphomonas pacifica]RAN38419.1 hypothetical protein HY11_00985 [Hyphomonas pacifica]